MVGKLGIGITYSASNGNELVANYLNKVLTYWGIPIIGNLNIAHLIDNEEAIATKIDNLVIKTLALISDIKKLNFEALEKIFELYRVHYKNVGINSPENPEYQSWKLNGFFDEFEYEALFKKKFQLYPEN